MTNLFKTATPKPTVIAIRSHKVKTISHNSSFISPFLMQQQQQLGSETKNHNIINPVSHRRKGLQKMTSTKRKDCKNICHFVFFIIAVATGVVILVIALMMNAKYSPKSHDQPLVIKVAHFSVSNLNLSNSISEANWEAKLLFGNQHRLFEITIQTSEAFVYYNHEDALSCAVLEAVHLGPKRQKLVQVGFNASGCVGGEQPLIEDKVLQEIKKDVENGTLHLGLMFNPQVAYKKGPWSWVFGLEPRCTGLDLPFEIHRGTGILVSDEPKSCFVPLLN